MQRRVREQYGERETVSRAARRILRSYVDWGVLAETSRKGVYTYGLRLEVRNRDLISWLLEAVLCAKANDSAPIKDLLESPALFPFRLGKITGELAVRTNPRLEYMRLGLNDEMLMLRKK